jgi:cell division protein FtsL
MRSLCLLAFGCLVGLVVYTYDLKLKTRALEVEARDLVTALQDESDFLALMKAEVSYLARPDRLEDMARKTLKLQPVEPAQIVTWSAIKGRSEMWQAQTLSVPEQDGIAALIAKSAWDTSAQPGQKRP